MLPKTSSSRKFYEKSESIYKKSLIKKGRIVVWTSKSGDGSGHVSFVLSDIDVNKNFKTFEFNTKFLGEENEGIGTRNRNQLTDEKFKIFGVLEITNAWKKNI